MTRIKYFSIVIILLCADLNAYSQRNFALHLGAAIPLSDFRNSDMDNNSGGAGTGIGIGLQYIYSLAENGLGVFVGIDFYYNELASDMKDKLLDRAKAEYTGFDVDITFFKYLNFPISAGLNYPIRLNKYVSLMINIGLTGNLVKMTNFILKVDNEELTTEFDVANSLGYKIGSGILINKKVSIEVNYFGLGNHGIYGLVTGGGLPAQGGTIEQKIDIFTVTLGYRF